MTEPHDYGNYYWKLRTRDSDIWIHADTVEVLPSGALVFLRVKKDGSATPQNFIVAPGEWQSVYAASVIDGGAVAVMHWDLIKPVSPSKSQPWKVNKTTRWKVMKRDGFKCVKCGAAGDEARLEIDHINPVSKGGPSTEKNLQTLCFNCNRGKRDS